MQLSTCRPSSGQGTFKQHSPHRARSSPRRRPLRHPVTVEMLESRLAPANLFVDTNANDGAGSLRYIIENAADGDTIAFRISDQTITLASQITIAKSLTIDGQGQNITISGGGVSRIFNVDDGFSTTTIYVVMLGLTLTRGQAPAGVGGGAILNAERLWFENANITNSHTNPNSGYGYGGGIYNGSNGALTLTNVVVSGNSASSGGGSGGGIYSNGTMTLSHTMVTGNSASSDGGGIYNTHMATLTNGTVVSENSAGVRGGGISSSGGTLSISDCAVLENSAAALGGGIFIGNASGTVLSGSISNTTVAGNVVGGYGTPFGGGIYGYFANLTINNSTVSGNSGAAFGGGHCLLLLLLRKLA